MINLIRSSIILGAVTFAAPATAQSLVGTWDCRSGDGATNTRTIETYAADGSYDTEFTIDSEAQGSGITLKGRVSGGYEMLGPQLKTTPEKIDLHEASVGGQNLLDGAMKEQILASVRGVLPGSETALMVSKLTENLLEMGPSGTGNRCTRMN